MENEAPSIALAMAASVALDELAIPIEVMAVGDNHIERIADDVNPSCRNGAGDHRCACRVDQHAVGFDVGHTACLAGNVFVHPRTELGDFFE